MIPVSQINIGGDPLLNTQGFNIEEQLRQLELRRQSLESMKQLNPQAMPNSSVIWNEIDTEVKVLSNEQLQKLFENEKSAVIGFEFKITENLKITPNFKMTFTENNQNPKNYLAYLNCTYSF